MRKPDPWLDPMQVDKPVICLYDLAEGCLGLIILRPSGVVYWNQAGGVNCLQPAAEGFFVPIGSARQEQAICDYILKEKYAPTGAPWLELEDADPIDAILASSKCTAFITVDRARINESCEAWVYVDIAAHARQPSRHGLDLTPIYGFGACKGVLTWANSD